MGEGERPVYQAGDSVQFQWKSTFPRFDLAITQVNIETQDRTNDKIYDNEPNTTSNFIWTAQNFDGLSQNDPLHLWITDADNTDCEACRCRSANFTILDATSSNTSSTSTSASAPSATAPDSSETATSDGKSHEHLTLGLGLGIPLLITFTALTTWLCARRRRQQRSSSRAAMAGFDGASSQAHSSTTMPLAPTQAYNHVYPSDMKSEKSPPSEMDSADVAEMQTDVETARVEAPQDTAVRAELAGDEGMLSRGKGDGKGM